MQLVPTYLPSIEYMAELVAKPIHFTLRTNYQKQTYRNRCSIYGANGKLNLIIPVEHNKVLAQQKDGDVKIKWDENWQKQHWKSIASAYSSSPFFEFYEDELKAAFFMQPKTLAAFNQGLLRCIFDWLDLEDEFLFSDKYKALTPLEEYLINPKQESDKLFPKYVQVFDNKHGFIPNLSVLDLIFNLGPESYDYLDQMANPNQGE